MDYYSLPVEEENTASLSKVEHIPEELIQEFREVFSVFDFDGDGTISTEELVDVLRSMGKVSTQWEIDEMVHEFDANGDGSIDFEEFKVLMYKKMKNTEGEDDIKQVFKVLDMNHRGYFTAVELYKVTTILGENVSVEEAQELINGTETKEPGKVNYEEFCHLVKVLIGRQ